MCISRVHVLLFIALAMSPPLTEEFSFGLRPEDTQTVFPGVDWDDLKQNWGYWWDGRCLLYTEEALLVATQPEIGYQTASCGAVYRFAWHPKNGTLVSNSRNIFRNQTVQLLSQEKTSK